MQEQHRKEWASLATSPPCEGEPKGTFGEGATGVGVNNLLVEVIHSPTVPVSYTHLRAHET